MAQGSNQIQVQKQEQRQTLSQQQLLFVRLLELPTEGLEERVRSEVLENPALEEGRESSDEDDYGDSSPDSAGNTDDNQFNDNSGNNEDFSLGDYRTEDDIPDYKLQERNSSRGATVEEIPFSDSISFYEILKEQLGECSLAPHQRELAEYLIGSLDDDGLLRKGLESMEDELGIYHGINTNQEELISVLKVIQDFDPVGIGARNLQECLLLQLRRKADSPVKDTAQAIIEKCYEDFTYKRWDRIMQRLNLEEEDFKEALDELTHLNPRPGSSLGESMDKGMQQIIPDFIIEIDDNDNITFSLNNSNVPDLRINHTFNRMMQEHAQSKNPSKESKDALLFLKQKVDSAQNFIDAVKQRQRTLTITMQAIIELQRPFFLEGDELLLKPMILKNVADITGLDISTISRVSNSKYAQTDFGVYPLKFFFSDSYRKPVIALARSNSGDSTESNEAGDNGEERSLRQIRAVIQECVDNEDKQNPFTDEELVKVLKEKGFELARRTIAKYRQQLGIPVARMRR